MCVFRIGAAWPNSGRMKWKVIRLELASNGEFPRGSAGRTYLIRLPLNEDGQIDAGTLDAQPARATVRRYWANQADRLGYLVRTPAGYAIRYEANGHGDSDPQLFRFNAEAIRIGEQIALTELDGRELQFRVASLQ
jgi:hypothetical protein